MRNKILASLALAFAMLAFSGISSNADPGRHPLRVVRTLQKTTKFFFWSSSHTVNLTVIISDKNQDGKYDSYIWMEDGKTLHEGRFSSYINSIKLEQLIKNEAKNNIPAYINSDFKEIELKVPSSQVNNMLGTFIVDAEFNNPMEFLTVTGEDCAEENAIPMFDPHPILDPIEIVRYSKNNDKELEKHHILLSDQNNDGNFDVYMYLINNEIFKTGVFKSLVSSKIMKDKFIKEVVYEEKCIIEQNGYYTRIPICSKFDGKSFGYLELNSLGEMQYKDYPDFQNPYVTIAEKLGITAFPNPCVDYISILTNGLLNMTARIDLYQNNYFIDNLFYGLITENTMRFNISHLQSGMYQFIITTDNDTVIPLPFVINK